MNIKLFPDSAVKEGGSPPSPKPNSRPVKPDATEKAPPKEVLAKTFSLEAANEGVEQLPTLDPEEGHAVTAEEKKGVKEAEVKSEKEVKPKEEVEEKPEEKPEEKVEEGIERFLKPPKGSEAEKVALAKKGQQFDLSKFTPAEQDILKKMPKENVPAVMKLMEDAKEVANSKQNQFFSHPDGYLLHPGYKQEVAIIQQADLEGKIWSQQLKAIKNGDAVKLLVGIKDGKPIYSSQATPASDELEEAVRNNMNQCMAVSSEKRTAVQNFVKNFPQLAQKDFETIKAERAKRFVWVADPKLLDHSIETSEGDKTIKQIKTDVSSLFPAYMRGTEAVEVCGDLMVSLMLSKNELNEYKKGKKVEVVKKEEMKSIEPNGSAKPKKIRDVGPGGVRTFSTEGAGVEI